MPKVQLPQGKTILDVVVGSCEAYAGHCVDVKIDESALTALVEAIDPGQIQPLRPKNYPLRFDSISDEINIITLSCLLSMGSGYRAALPRKLSEVIDFGVMGMFLTNKLDAEFLCKVSLSDIESYFGIPVEQEYEVMPGVKSTRAHPLRSLAEGLLKICNHTGSTLASLQYKDFASLILDVPKVVDVTDHHKHAEAAAMVHRLVESFPMLLDRYEVKTKAKTSSEQERQGEKEWVWLLKNAMGVVATLGERFKEEKHIGEFQFSDSKDFPALADPELVRALHSVGVLQLSSALQDKITAKQPLLLERQVCELRACAVAACQKMVNLQKAHPK